MGRRDRIIVAIAVLAVAWLAGWAGLYPGESHAADPSTFTQVGSLVDPGSNALPKTTALSDGTLFVGAPDTSLTTFGQGAIVAYDEPPGGWSGTPAPSATLEASDPQADDALGTVLITSGTSVITGDSVPAGAGEIRVFDKPPDGWSGTVPQSATLTGPSGVLLFSPVASGSTITALGEAPAPDGTEGQVSLYVFSEPAGGWAGRLTPSAILQAPGEASLTANAAAVAIGAGEIVAGSQASSAVEVFDEPAGGWSGVLSPTATLTAGGAAVGASVALVGTTVVSGADSIDTATPQETYAFTEPSAGWTSEGPTAMLSAAGTIGFRGSAPMESSGSTLLVPVLAEIDHNELDTYAVYDMPSGGFSGSDVEPNAALSVSGDINLETADFDEGEVIAGVDTLGTSADEQTVATLEGAEVFPDVAMGSGAISPSAALASPYRPSQPEIFTQPTSGWASAPTPSATIAVSPTAQGDTVDSFSADGAEVAATWSADHADVYTESSSGWAATGAPAATLVDRRGWPLSVIGLAGDLAAAVARDADNEQILDIFQAPAGGWGGTLTPVAQIPFGLPEIYAVAISGSTIVATTQEGTAVVDTPQDGDWADGVGSSQKLRLARGIEETPISFSGHDLVVGASLGGRWATSDGGAAIYAPGRQGQAYLTRPVATLVGQINAGYAGSVFAEPATGWRGRVVQSASLSSAFAPLISPDGREISVSGGTGSDEGCSSEDQVLSEPAAGWTGSLTGQGDETPLSESGPCGESGVSALQFDGLVLIAALGPLGIEHPAELDVYAMNPVPVAGRLTPGRPRIASLRLSGVRAGRPQLALTVAAGAHEPNLTSLSIDLPAGLSVPRSVRGLARRITLCRRAGVSCTAPSAHALAVHIDPDRVDAGTETLRLPAGLLGEDPALRRARPHRVRLSTRITDAAGSSTTRTASVRLD